MKETGTFTEHIKGFSEEVHETAREHGFGGYTEEKYLLLMHSEIAEITEALRHDNPLSKKIPGFSLVEEEVADLIIRALDYGEGKELDIAGALIAKARYNKGRPYKHGKKW